LTSGVYLRTGVHLGINFFIASGYGGQTVETLAEVRHRTVVTPPNPFRIISGNR
jgi:hypothetical protein